MRSRWNFPPKLFWLSGSFSKPFHSQNLIFLQSDKTLRSKFVLMGFWDQSLTKFNQRELKELNLTSWNSKIQVRASGILNQTLTAKILNKKFWPQRILRTEFDLREFQDQILTTWNSNLSVWAPEILHQSLTSWNSNVKVVSFWNLNMSLTSWNSDFQFWVSSLLKQSLTSWNSNI